MLRHIVATVYGLAFIWIGIAHFITPENFAEIVPPLFMFPLFWAYASGVMEIAGGLAIIVPRARVYAGRFLALFLVGVYPANLYMWTHDIPYNGTTFGTLGHIIRLVIQILLIAVALFLSGDLQSLLSNSSNEENQ